MKYLVLEEEYRSDLSERIQSLSGRMEPVPEDLLRTIRTVENAAGRLSAGRLNDRELAMYLVLIEYIPVLPGPPEDAAHEPEADPKPVPKNKARAKPARQPVTVPADEDVDEGESD